MYKLKNRLIKLFVISALAILPYAVIDASVTDSYPTISSNDEVVDQIAIRVRSGAKVKASPVRAHERREVRREGMDDEDEYYEEEYSEPTEEQYYEPIQHEEPDRGRPGGRR